MEKIFGNIEVVGEFDGLENHVLVKILRQDDTDSKYYSKEVVKLPTLSSNGKVMRNGIIYPFKPNKRMIQSEYRVINGEILSNSELMSRFVPKTYSVNISDLYFKLKKVRKNG